MQTITRNNHHSFTVYTNNDIVRVAITQFASDEFADLYIVSDMGVHLSKDEARRLIEMLQEAL